MRLHKKSLEEYKYQKVTQTALYYTPNWMLSRKHIVCGKRNLIKRPSWSSISIPRSSWFCGCVTLCYDAPSTS